MNPTSDSRYLTAVIRESSVYILAPLYQQVVDWFREKHRIIIRHDQHVDSWGTYDPLEKYFQFALIKVDGNGCSNAFHSKDRGKSFDSYYEAFDFAIEEALKLI